MIAAWYNPQGKIYPFCHQQVGGGDHGFRIGGMVEDLQFAIVHVDAGIPADSGPGDHFQHLSRGDPQAGAEARRPLEYMVKYCATV